MHGTLMNSKDSAFSLRSLAQREDSLDPSSAQKYPVSHGNLFTSHHALDRCLQFSSSGTDSRLRRQG